VKQVAFSSNHLSFPTAIPCWVYHWAYPVFLKAQFFESQLMWSWSSGAAAAAGGLLEHVVTRRLRLIQIAGG
jgi:hypothetical protein